MIAPQALNQVVDALQQTHAQILIGGSLALFIRGGAHALLLAASVVSKRATQIRIKRLHDELTLYTFFERRPAVLTARSIGLQLWAGLFAFAFVDVWAFAAAAALQPPITILVAAVQVAISAAVFWVFVDLFRLVRPLSQYQKFEAAIKGRIQRMKEKLSKARQRLKNEEGQLEKMDELWAQAATLASQQPEEVTESRRDATPQATNETPAKEVPHPGRSEEGAEPATAPSNAEQSPPPRYSESSPGRATSSTIYESSWISGRVKRWPEWGPFGFITSEAGEDFFVDAAGLAGFEPPVEGQQVLFQAAPGDPHRKAALVCALGSYAQGRVNGVRGNVGFISIFDSQRSASIYFRLAPGAPADFGIGDTVGFRFGRNIIGPTAERIDTDLRNRPRPTEAPSRVDPDY